MPATKAQATSSTVEINGYALRWGRKLMKLNPAELADAIGRDRTYVVKIETGAVTRVSTKTFEALVAALVLEDSRALLAFPHKDAA
jgi:transcriptional regulator with XRE-family HTH domain